MAVQRLLENADTVRIGVPIEITNSDENGHSGHTFQLMMQSVTACEIKIEGSLDGVHYSELCHHVVEAEAIIKRNDVFSLINVAMKYMRANLVGLEGDSVDLYYIKHIAGSAEDLLGAILDSPVECAQ